MTETEFTMQARRAGLDELRQVKLRLPVRLLARLQMMKLVHGVAFGDVVSQALNAYFANEGLGDPADGLNHLLPVRQVTSPPAPMMP